MIINDYYSTESLCQKFEKLHFKITSKGVSSQALRTVWEALETNCNKIIYCKNDKLQNLLSKLACHVLQDDALLSERLERISSLVMNVDESTQLALARSNASWNRIGFKNKKEVIDFIIEHQLENVDFSTLPTLSINDQSPLNEDNHITDDDLERLTTGNPTIRSLTIYASKFLESATYALKLLPNLEELRIRDCIYFYDRIQLEFNPKLRVLEISGSTEFDKKLPLQFTPVLEVLILKGNTDLDKPLPVQFLKKLKYVDLTDCLALNQPLDFRAAKHLETLLCDQCEDLEKPVILPKKRPANISFKNCHDFRPSKHLFQAPIDPNVKRNLLKN